MGCLTKSGPRVRVGLIGMAVVVACTASVEAAETGGRIRPEELVYRGAFRLPEEPEEFGWGLDDLPGALGGRVRRHMRPFRGHLPHDAELPWRTISEVAGLIPKRVTRQRLDVAAFCRVCGDGCDTVSSAFISYSATLQPSAVTQTPATLCRG